MSNDIQLMVGDPVPPGAARYPERITLTGRTTRLVPLALDHAASIFENTRSPEHDDVWAYLADGPYAARAELEAAMARKAAATDAVFFSILDPNGNALGYASYMRIDPPNRVIEVGNVLFSPAMQGTTMATEAMYLMARHAFEDLGYRRYEWKCNDLNEPSKRAATRFGFVFEGVFRQHMIVKGRNRDTAWYSMLDQEWPSRRDAFERWLDPANFDAHGRQRQRLRQLREER